MPPRRRNPELLESSQPDPDRYKREKKIGGAAAFLAGQKKAAKPKNEKTPGSQ